ncbi:MAG: HupE/UreJ family protein [Rhodospirillaceae bacterium]|nr:HupE/UreJ family protein [Rhodospirillaceae bacterium]
MESRRPGRFALRAFLPLLCAGLFARTAEAHLFGAHGAAAAEGLAHPFAGLDHLLAMIAVGVWAVQQGGRALWAVPTAFVAAMAIGGALSLFGGTLPATESVIAGSLIVLGLLVGLAVRPAPWIAACVVGFFALFHGHAHGGELPDAGAPWLYALGFIVANVALHGVGMIGGLALGAKPLSRWAGAGVTAAGLALVLVAF